MINMSDVTFKRFIKHTYEKKKEKGEPVYRHLVACHIHRLIQCHKKISFALSEIVDEKTLQWSNTRRIMKMFASWGYFTTSADESNPHTVVYTITDKGKQYCEYIFTNAERYNVDTFNMMIDLI